MGGRGGGAEVGRIKKSLQKVLLMSFLIIVFFLILGKRKEVIIVTLTLSFTLYEDRQRKRTNLLFVREIIKMSLNTTSTVFIHQIQLL